MARVEPDPSPRHAPLDGTPDPGVVAGERALSRVVQVDALVRPGERDVRRAADRGGAATDHAHRARRSDAAVRRVQVGRHLCVGPDAGLAPEPVAHTGRDHEDVVRLLLCAAVGTADRDVPGAQVRTHELTLHRPRGAQPAVAVEADPVVASPVVGAGEPQPELLSADVRRLNADRDHVEVRGQVDGRQQSRVTEPRDDHPRAGHAPALRGGRGSSRGTRATTSA